MSAKISSLALPAAWQKHWQKALAAAFWLLALGSYLIYSIQNQLSPLASLQQVSQFMSRSSLGPLLFIGLYVLRPLFLFSASLLTLAAGFLFGPFWGVVYTVIGSNLGASLAFLIGRFFGEGLIRIKDSNQGLGVYIKRLRANSFETVFIMRLIFLPYDLVNYLAGLLRINYWAFISATALGALPGTISFVLFGASTGLSEGGPRFDWRIFAASLAIFAISLLLSRLLKRKKTLT